MVLPDVDESWLQRRWFRELSAMRAHGIPPEPLAVGDTEADALRREATNVIGLAIDGTMIS